MHPYLSELDQQQDYGCSVADRALTAQHRTMRVDDFDFELPEQLIALRPAAPRDSARLLVVREDGTRDHRSIRDLPQLLQPSDVLVVNDSKVIAARLHGLRHRIRIRPGRPTRKSNCCCTVAWVLVHFGHSRVLPND